MKSQFQLENILTDTLMARENLNLWILIFTRRYFDQLLVAYMKFDRSNRGILGEHYLRDFLILREILQKRLIPNS